MLSYDGRIAGTISSETLGLKGSFLNGVWESKSQPSYTHIIIVLFAEDVANAKEGSCQSAGYTKRRIERFTRDIANGDARWSPFGLRDREIEYHVTRWRSRWLRYRDTRYPNRKIRLKRISETGRPSKPGCRRRGNTEDEWLVSHGNEDCTMTSEYLRYPIDDVDSRWECRFVGNEGM